MNDTVLSILKRNKPAAQNPGNSTRDMNQPLVLLNAREAAAYLRVSLSTLHRMESRGQIQALRTPGGHRRFTLAMLNSCLDSL